jgi:predicted kinase
VTVDIPGAAAGSGIGSGVGPDSDSDGGTGSHSGTGQTRATLVYIYGPPASGKLTVAGRLSELTGMPLFHNHLTVNALRPVFAFGSPPFVEANRKMRLAVFEAAARAGISLIFTNNSAWSGPDPRTRFEEAADSSRRIMESHGGRTVFVRLTASQPALEERVANESRRAHDKLVDVVRLRELLAELDPSPLHPDDLTIDTGQLSPEESARTIMAALA